MLNLSEHGERLVAEHRIMYLSECRSLEEAELLSSGLTRIECRRFMAAAQLLARPSRRLVEVMRANSGGEELIPAVAATAPGSDVMISYRVPETGEGGDRSVFALQDALLAHGFSVFVGESAIQAGDT